MWLGSTINDAEEIQRLRAELMEAYRALVEVTDDGSCATATYEKAKKALTAAKGS